MMTKGETLEYAIKKECRKFSLVEWCDEWGGLPLMILRSSCDLARKPLMQSTRRGAMDDTISRVMAINALESIGSIDTEADKEYARSVFEALPSAQPEQTKMIKEIRKWINSKNRGSADYFIVDKIEEIINKYE